MLDFKYTNMVGTYALNKRFSASFKNYGYTVAMWLKTSPKIIHMANPYAARDNGHIMKINEAFFLWFSAKTQIRAYFFALRDYYESYSKPIFFPLGQWANLQFAFDHYNGYEMRVYDL